jgi:NAD(P)-dependent dehydrogenase (short-subunit alcohol dehydrogenase family)
MLNGVSDWLLDRTILFSFDRSGFRRHARGFRKSDLEVDLTGRVCLVTGANSGIGREAATALADRGAEVWLLCRDRRRGEEARRAIRKRTGNRRVHLAVVDVSHLGAIRAFAAAFAPARVDVLIHNAGVLPAAREQSPEGLESTLATNVIGPFLLTHLLRERLAAAAGARVIFVSSGGMYAQKLSLEDLQWTRRPFDGVTAYAQTKRMQVILTELLARRWERAGIAVHAMHPGWADTPSVRTSIPRFWKWMRTRLRTPAQGADTLLWLAVAPALPSGQFWFDRTAQSTHLLPFTAEEPRERDRLWRTCVRLAGLTKSSGERRAGAAVSIRAGRRREGASRGVVFMEESS